ncbi:hypothetical protein SAMN04487895_11734 [Paenibacillus sophorae]|uniref:Uncharacterized protein n=1 Tax=Paenibacillus sophorae TaxID=1333845 RepID=A0A1H8UCU6_9BACL|nr:MobP3 family relaxase [Paenibacillus sophorae]QWU13184.1 hypothetical protein KP014_14260 [Paenibacillus sophorae]SEP00991.1 hypothetical protein SAMN04487895_11734 [Paenibacillus sophorae]
MSALIYKQRFFHPNHPKTALSNYVHIGYIATRPGTVRHENMSHGLFGKQRPGELQAFDSWQEVARIARQISQQGKNMYRSVISFRKETALELGLTDFTDWQHYIEQHITTLAAHNRIKTENLCWAAAFHYELDHPHLHVVFWDKAQTIMKNFTHPEVPNLIRKQLIKDTFAYKIKEFCAQRDQFKSGVIEVTDSIVEEFEAYLKRLDPKAFQTFQLRFEQEDEDSLLRFPKHHLVEPASVKLLAEKLFVLRRHMPKTGRLAYKLIPPETKALLDALVQDLLQDNRYLAQMVEDYVQAKLNLAMLYDSDPEHLDKHRAKYQAESEKRIVNRILSTIRTIIKLEKEAAFDIRQANRQYAMAEQLLLDLLNLMEGLFTRAQLDYDDKTKVLGGDLSKQAKKEWLLRHKDQGMER